MKKFLRLSVILALIFTMVMSFSGCAKKETVIHIGHKNFTEQRILGQMFAVLIENKLGYKTDVKELGGTNIAFEALKSGDIDMYPSYTGTAYVAILGESGLNDPNEIYDYVKQKYKEEYNIDWLNVLGFNNTYTFAVVSEVAEKYNLKTFSDLSKVADQLTLVATTEFIERTDGLPGAMKAYGGFDFKDKKSMDAGLRYAAISENKGDVMDAFSTDGKLIEYNLVVLKDDKGFFPPYYVAPILNGDFAEKHQDVAELLNTLGDTITEEEMQQMNYDVDNQHLNERDVAKDFLIKKGLLSK